MICNEIKCHVNTSLGLVGGHASPAPPSLCPRLIRDVTSSCDSAMVFHLGLPLIFIWAYQPTIGVSFGPTIF